MRPNLVPALFNARRYSSQSSIQEWISSTLAQSPTRHTDTIDPLRASHLLRTLPTRQHSPPSLRDGDELVKGGNMIYFQPETMLSDLGRDGSSTVSHVISCLNFNIPLFLLPVFAGIDYHDMDRSLMNRNTMHPTPILEECGQAVHSPGLKVPTKIEC
jgi:hypothetical protein